jgi:hypothetical protein
MYDVTVTNNTAVALTANGNTIATGRTSQLPYSPTGCTISVPEFGTVHVSDGPNASVRISSGDESRILQANVVALTIEAAGMMTMDFGSNASTTEMSIVDDPQDFALIQSGALPNISTIAAQHTFSLSDFTISLLNQFLPGPQGVIGDTALLYRTSSDEIGFKVFLQGAIDAQYVRLHVMLTTGSTSYAEYVSDCIPAAYDGQWHAYAVVRSGSTISMYIDGEALTVRSYGNVDAGVNLHTLAPLYVGSYRLNGDGDTVIGGSNYGLIEDVTLWRRALPAHEIPATMTNQLTGGEQGLVGLFELNNSLTDSSPTREPARASGGAPQFAAILHSFRVVGRNEHVLMTMGAPSTRRPTRTHSLNGDTDGPLTRTQTISVGSGAPFLYGALCAGDGTANPPQGVTLFVLSPTGPVSGPLDSDSRYMTMSGPSVRAFVFKNPTEGDWQFTVTAPQGAGFELFVQTSPVTDIARTMVTTARMAYPAFGSTPSGLSTVALSDDWSWYDYAASGVACMALAAVAIIAAPAVVGAAAAAPVTALCAWTAGAALTQAVVLIGSYAVAQSSLDDASLKMSSYARFDPRPAVTVYVWSYIAFSGAVGHAAMELSDGTYISWWPAGVKDESTLAGKAETFSANHVVNRTFAQDVVAEGDPTGQPPTTSKDPDYRIKVFGLNEQAMKAWWANQQETENYRVLTQNCSTVVAGALIAGGAMTELTVSEYHVYQGVPVWTPNLVQSFAAILAARTAAT